MVDVLVPRVKPVVFVDIDDTQLALFPELEKFLGSRGIHKLEGTAGTSYNLEKRYGLSREEVISNLKDFYGSDFLRCLPEIEGTRDALERLSEVASLFSISARPSSIRDATLESLELRFPGIYSSQNVILNGDAFQRNGKGSAKIQSVRDYGAVAVFDDRVGTFHELRKAFGTTIGNYLFGNYPYQEEVPADDPGRLRSWSDLEEKGIIEDLKRRAIS